MMVVAEMRAIVVVGFERQVPETRSVKGFQSDQ